SGGGTLSFNISGIEAASSTSGITTDVGTTPTEIDFGSLPEDTPVNAAQRLAVSTNANTGYEVYAYEAQGFTGEEGAQIPPVTGTNAAPTAWTSGCSLTSAGCFGYHTSESVLGIGNTIRFAANDSYAGFTQNLSEVAYSANATDYKATDIIYKV